MFGMNKRIYLDYASATPVLPSAARAVKDASRYFGNPGAIHHEAVAAQRVLESSRERIALELGCKTRELIFTSGLTEANNLAVIGRARFLERTRRTLTSTHWIVSSIEHASVLECFAEIERMGGVVSHVEPEPSGRITADSVVRKLRPETVFVSVGWGNNEIGTMQPLAAIAQSIRTHEREHKTTVLFHTDAGQAPIYKAVNVHTLGVDLFSLCSGKLYGPRGIGALYASNRAELAPILFGGNQERGLRPGTQEVALSAGFAEAFVCITREREREAARLRKLRDDLTRKIVARIPNAIINGDLTHTLPHMLNVSIPEINSEYLVLALDRMGIALSTKSACREGESHSHVVASLGGPPWRAHNTLRFSLGRDTTARDIQRTIEILGTLLQGEALNFKASP